MGQKISSTSLRIGFLKSWDSKWYAESRTYGRFLTQDLQLRTYLENYFKKNFNVVVSQIKLYRRNDIVRVYVYLYAPYINSKFKSQLKKQNHNLNTVTFSQLQQNIRQLFDLPDNFLVQVHPILISDFFHSANLVAQNLAIALEKHTPVTKIFKDIQRRISRIKRFKSINKKSFILNKVNKVIENPFNNVSNEKVLKGIKIQISGRIQGAEIARKEMFKIGRIPLQTLNADISFAKATAFTIYGTQGVKVWLYFE